MPSYNDLRTPKDYEQEDYALVFPTMSESERIRTIKNLLQLKQGLLTIPPRKTDQNLLVASWNIKEFGHTKQRLPEAYFYIAEILEKFDLIAVQEVKSTLKDLDIVMRLLGTDWLYLVTDITGGNDGNKERSAYVFNTKRVGMSGFTGAAKIWQQMRRRLKSSICAIGDAIKFRITFPFELN